MCSCRPQCAGLMQSSTPANVSSKLAKLLVAQTTASAWWGNLKRTIKVSADLQEGVLMFRFEYSNSLVVLTLQVVFNSQSQIIFERLLKKAAASAIKKIGKKVNPKSENLSHISELHSYFCFIFGVILEFVSPPHPVSSSIEAPMVTSVCHKDQISNSFSSCVQTSWQQCNVRGCKGGFPLRWEAF